jgi:hypothetical protein
MGGLVAAMRFEAFYFSPPLETELALYLVDCAVQRHTTGDDASDI